jgi:hypothetical protein
MDRETHAEMLAVSAVMPGLAVTPGLAGLAELRVRAGRSLRV